MGESPVTTQGVARVQAEQALHNTTYHRPEAEIMERMVEIRAEFQTLITAVEGYTADVDMPRERAMAYTHLEEALQCVIGGLARHA
jgi:hypothetical protein